MGLAVWGLATFAIIPAFQLRVITLAGLGADLAAALGASAVNARIAVGSLVGGAVIVRHSASSPFLVAIVVSAAAVPAVWAARFLRPPGIPASSQAANGTAAPVRPVQDRQNQQP